MKRKKKIYPKTIVVTVYGFGLYIYIYIDIYISMEVVAL